MTKRKTSPAILWRLETEHGRGPYQDPVKAGAYSKGHYDMETHPNPNGDRDLKTGHTLAYTILDAYPHDKWLFGHSSIAQAKEWWSVSDLREAEQYGMELSAYACRDLKRHADGQFQSVFVPRPGAGPIARFPVRDLYTLPEHELTARALAHLEGPAHDDAF